MRLHKEEAEGGIGMGLIGFHREESRAETGIGTGLIGFHRENDRIFQFPAADRQTEQVTCQNRAVGSAFCD